MKNLEIFADNLHTTGWSYGYVETLDRNGRKIWIADAHRDGKRFIVRADELLTAFFGTGKGGLYPPIDRRTSAEKLTAFVELESAIRGS